MQGLTHVGVRGHNTIARLLGNIRPPLDLPCVCHTPYNIGNDNIVSRPTHLLLTCDPCNPIGKHVRIPGPIAQTVWTRSVVVIHHTGNNNMLGRWVNPHREQQTIPQGQTSSPPKSFLTPTAEARPDQAALATSAEARGATHRTRPRSV